MAKLFGPTKYYYHSHTRKLLAIFGYVFSDIYAARFSQEGKVTDLLGPIPITYSAGDSDYMLAKHGINSDSEYNSQKFKEVFPRMTYSLENISYDPELKVNNKHVISFVDARGNNRQSKTPAPYRASFTLNIIGRNHNEPMQVFEQISGVFNPSVKVQVKNFPIEGSVYDMPISLIATSIEDNFDQDEKRRVIYRMEFEVRFNIYGPLGSEIEYDALINKLSKEIGGHVQDNDIENLRGQYNQEVDDLVQSYQELVRSDGIANVCININSVSNKLIEDGGCGYEVNFEDVY